MADQNDQYPEENKKDPRGLIMHDVNHLRQVFRKKRYSPKNSHAEIMFNEGINTVIDYIEDKMIAKGAGRG